MGKSNGLTEEGETRSHVRDGVEVIAPMVRCAVVPAKEVLEAAEILKRPGAAPNIAFTNFWLSPDDNQHHARKAKTMDTDRNEMGSVCMEKRDASRGDQFESLTRLAKAAERNVREAGRRVEEARTDLEFCEVILQGRRDELARFLRINGAAQ